LPHGCNDLVNGISECVGDGKHFSLLVGTKQLQTVFQRLRVLALIPEHGFFLGTSNLEHLYIKTMNILGTKKLAPQKRYPVSVSLICKGRELPGLIYVRRIGVFQKSGNYGVNR
jgi:hypothetical protein